MLLLGLAGVGNCGQEKERSLKANIKSSELLGSILTMTILSTSGYHPSQTSLSLESGSLQPASPHQSLGCRGEAPLASSQAARGLKQRVHSVAEKPIQWPSAWARRLGPGSGQERRLVERPTANSTFFHAQPWPAAGPRWLSGGWHSEPLSPFLLPDRAFWQAKATFLFKIQLSTLRTLTSP